MASHWRGNLGIVAIVLVVGVSLYWTQRDNFASKEWVSTEDYRITLEGVQLRDGGLIDEVVGLTVKGRSPVTSVRVRLLSREDQQVLFEQELAPSPSAPDTVAFPPLRPIRDVEIGERPRLELRLNFSGGHVSTTTRTLGSREVI